MKRILHLFTIAVLFVSCEKESLSADWLIGSWKIKKILPLNGNSGFQELVFRNGTFTFNENRSFIFKNFSEIYEGYWVLSEDQQERDCYTGLDGNRECNYDVYEELYLEATQTTTQQKKTANFKFLTFSTDGTFTGRIYSPTGIAAFEYTFEKFE
jgi:hypothetical protein